MCAPFFSTGATTYAREGYINISRGNRGKQDTAADSSGDTMDVGTPDASKAIPGFDVIDYGQEDCVFGSSTADARHWSKNVLFNNG